MVFSFFSTYCIGKYVVSDFHGHEAHWNFYFNELQPSNDFLGRNVWGFGYNN